MIKWKKPSGVEVETNDNPDNVEYCISLGWKRLDDEDVTVEMVKTMSAKELKQLIKDCDLDVKSTGKVDEIRAAVIAVM